LAERARGTGLIMLLWALVAVALVARAALLADAVPLHADPDDAMRMVTATDLLDGQPWQDTTQYRDNVPDGVPTHWSRLVDAPIAGLMGLARLVAPPLLAADIAAIAWPTLLLAVLMGVSLALYRQLRPEGDALPAIALPLLSLVLVVEFMPGRVDHHNVQIVLIMALVWALLAARARPGFAFLAGLLAATSLAVGLETLPLVVVALAVVGLRWVALGSPAVIALRLFALAFAIGVVGHFIAAVPQSHWFDTACDSLSAGYVVGALLGSAALLTASQTSVPQRAWPLRLIALSGLSIAAVGLSIAGQPVCLAGPYGGAQADYLARMIPAISEAQPTWQRLLADPAAVLGLVLGPILGLAACLWLVLREPRGRRGGWLVLLAFLAVAVAVMALQIRGARLAAALAVPPAAALIDMARAGYLAKSGPLRAGLLVATWLAFAGLIHYAAFDALARALPASTLAPAAATPERSEIAMAGVSGPACFLPESYRRLADLPAGRVMAALPIGAHVLRYTPHGVVSAGYHRNQAGYGDAVTFFAGGMEAARRIVDARGLDYIVFCRGLPEIQGLTTPRPGSFITTYRDGRHWTWLTPLSAPDDPLVVLKVLPRGPVVYADRGEAP
jgi:hypothetical protein